MSGKTTTTAAKVVAMPSKASRSADAKWSQPVMKQGFCIVPSLLLRAQRRLGLNPTQLAVLLQLCDYWWDHGRKPFPSKEAIGERLGLSGRQVQRYLADLEKAKLLSRNERKGTNGGQLSNEYDLSELVAKLKEIAPDFEEAKQLQKQAARRGGLAAVRMAKKTA